MIHPISLKLPITLTYHSDGLKIESCHGEISDLFRKMHFEEIVEPSLQDTERICDDFEEWLILYRAARLINVPSILESAKCD